ncbi:gamma-glutamylaminecyclotransferase isoform X2 [Heterocephalus glaber]|uniref:Gamma-glutamylaminecyclotransferase isoform X2 n=1 Tax=Heterocephalus glaber TaxID=10181 RepID=A0AAX6R0M5_HETGA|nr:gamma-glutamylaminecyclotransferase isoform X2 [Heterocephalus glaber]
MHYRVPPAGGAARGGLGAAPALRGISAPRPLPLALTAAGTSCFLKDWSLLFKTQSEKHGALGTFSKAIQVRTLNLQDCELNQPLFHKVTITVTQNRLKHHSKILPRQERREGHRSMKTGKQRAVFDLAAW